jgi:hypothetical protein
MLTAHSHRDKAWPTVTRSLGGLGSNSPSARIPVAFATTLDKSAKPIVSGSFTESLNNRIHADDAAKNDQPYQSSAQVS